MINPIKLEKTFEIDLDQNGTIDKVYVQIEGDKLNISAEMNLSAIMSNERVLLYQQKINASYPNLDQFQLNFSPYNKLWRSLKVTLPDRSQINLDELYQERVHFISFFQSRWNRIEELTQKVSDLSKSTSFSAAAAIAVLTEIRDLSNEYGGMAKYHQYSNDSLPLRQLGERYHSQMEEFQSRSLLLNSDYRKLLYRLRDDSSTQDEVTKQWVENKLLTLPKREVSPAEKEEYIQLSVQEVELGDKALAQVKEVEETKKYPVSLVDFNSFVDEGEFKKTALSTYEKKEEKIYIPASDVFYFSQKCKDRKLRNQLWKDSAKDLKQATHETVYKLLLNRARRAKILGWKNFAEYQLQTSVMGNIQNVREGLAKISQIYKPAAEQEIASLKEQSARDHLSLDTADFNYHLDHRPLASKAIILDSERPEYRNVLATFHEEMLPLTKGKIGAVEEVTAEQFKEDMPDISMWTSPKYLRFYKFYDISNQFVGYKVQDPFNREHKFDLPSAWEIVSPRPGKKFLMIISTKFDLKGKNPEGDFFLDPVSFRSELHENGHMLYNILRQPLSQLPPDGGEVPSIATETYFGLNKKFLKKILSDEKNVEIAYQEGSQDISNPVMFYERNEFAIRNMNYHSFSYIELKNLGSMDAVDKKIHEDRKRYSLFSPAEPDADSFTSVKYMFYLFKADLHRYILVDDIKNRLFNICEKVGYNPKLGDLVREYFIVPNAKRSRQPLFEKLDEFERETMKLRGQH